MPNPQAQATRYPAPDPRSWPGEEGIMNNNVRLIVCLIGIAVAAGCSSPQPAVVQEIGKQTRAAGASRSLEKFQSALTTNMTPKLAEESFGKPDRVTGSGLIIYVYVLADGKEIWLGFPGFAPIRYAKVKATDGSVLELKLK